jgi:hypothetical protein
VRFFYQGCLIGAILLTCCSHSSGQQTTVLAETAHTKSPEKNGDKKEETSQGIEDRVIKDKRLAANILVDAMGSQDTTLAAWAAVYIVRLGLKHDQNHRIRALTHGTLNSEDPLLNALCWRLLATVKEVSKIPNWAGNETTDPVVQVMAALALARRGPLPKTLKAALGLPKGNPSGADRGTESRRLVERLLAFSMPFDNGPLSLAIVFIEARRGEWIEYGSKGKKSTWVAQRLRDELIRFVLRDDIAAAEHIRASVATGHKRNSTLLETLNTPLVSRPMTVLRRAALAGPIDLRLDALRALAVVATKPVAGDLGASAAALTSDNPRLRVEGARTFLLLVTRTQQ